MIIDEDEYLEHFGTKGMKWGQRKNRSNKNKTPLTRAQKVNRAVTIAAGAAFAVSILATHKMGQGSRPRPRNSHDFHIDPLTIKGTEFTRAFFISDGKGNITEAWR